MTDNPTLVEVYPCDRHQSILSDTLEWFRARQIADDCLDCKVIES